MFATSLALVAHSFRGKDRGVAFGVWGAITGVTTGLGPILGGVITARIHLASVAHRSDMSGAATDTAGGRRCSA